MKSKVSVLVVFGLLLVFLMGCWGTYGGNSNYLSIVGTWSKASSTGDGANLPDQLIFTTNSFGSSAGGVYAAATFYWTYYGVTLSFYHTSNDTTPFLMLTAPTVGTVVSPMTLTTATGGTAIYNR